MISDDLRWCPHVEDVTLKGRHSTWLTKKKIKKIAQRNTEYFSTVRSVPEYASVVWDLT